MALTQIFPDFKLKSVPDEVVDLPAIPEFRTFSFRKGADLGFMADQVCKTGNFLVDAAPGTGKSTDFPQAIVKKTDSLVIHVMPFPQLAAHLADWHKSRPSYQSPVYVDSLEEGFPESGYVITYAALIVARWMQFGLRSMEGAILLQDESHESGAASAVIRRLAPEAKLKSYVAMSATHTGGVFRALESRGTVADREYTPESFADPWSVVQEGAPWAVDRIGRCTMIFEDDETRATELLSAYNLHNVVALRWTARTPVDRFLADIRLMKTMDHAKFAIVADSTYRSGYTLPVETIIDSGYVRRIADIGGGAFKQISRKIYLFEKHQTMARGGRTIGLSSSYYRPSEQLDAKRCIMEQTDIEAYVLILRMLGYSSSGEYESARFVVGDVPRDLCGALNNGVPLSCLVDYQLCPISECLTLSTVPSFVELESADDFDSDGCETLGEPRTGKLSFTEVGDLLDEIVATVKDEEIPAVPAEFGEPLLDSEKSRLLMPESVLRLVESMRSYFSESLLSNVTTFVWSPDECEINCSVAAARYNYHLTRFMAIAEALQDIKKRPADKDAVALTSWAKRYGEILVICQSEMRMWYEVAKLISAKRFDFLKGPNVFLEDIDAMKMDVYTSFNSLPEKMRTLDYTKVYGQDKRLEDRFKRRMLEIG